MDKIFNKCSENNLKFLGFLSYDGKYKNNKIKLKLKCNQCGYYWESTSYDKFISRPSKCPQCTNKKSLTKKEFIDKINKRCTELDYTFIRFVENDEITRNTKIELKCNKCKTIWSSTTINNFLNKDRKSHKCGKLNPTFNEKRKRKTDFNNDIEKICNYLNNSELQFLKITNDFDDTKKAKVLLYCKKCHNEVIYSLQYLLYKKNIKCRKCSFNNKLENDIAIKLIIEKCKLLNYEFLGFNTSDNRYNGKRTKLILKCNQCGRVWNTTSFYAFNKFYIKCVSCAKSWKLEEEVKNILEKHKIKYEKQKTFEWLRYKSKLFLDFYLPEYDIFIECQGRQHFMPVSSFGGSIEYEKVKKRDEIKFRLCKEHNIKPIYYGYKIWYSFNGEKMINNEKELLNRIKNG